MNTLKNIMRKVLVAVLSLAMTFTVAPNAGLEVYAEEGYGAWAGIYFGGSNAYYQSEHPEAVEMKVALYADGVKQQEYDFVASATDGTLNVDNLKEKNEAGEDIVYTWKIVSKSDIPEGFVVRIEPTSDGNNVVKFYLEGEIETEVNEAGEVVPVKDPVTGEDKVITFNPDDFEDFGNNEGQNGEGQNGENQNGEGQNGENQNGEGQNGENQNGEGQNGENQNGEGQNGENNQNGQNVEDNKENKDNTDNKDSKDSKDNKDSKESKDNKDSKTSDDGKTAVAGASVAQNAGPEVGTKVKDRKYFYEVTKVGSKDGKVVGELAVTGIRKKSITQIKLAKTGVFDGVKYKITSVKANAFKGNKKVTKAIISKNVTKVGKNAFANMKNLKAVTFTSKKLKTIGANAFKGDKKLKLIKIKSKKLKSVGKKSFVGVKNCTVKVLKAKKNAYTKILKKAGFKGKLK
ncbi:Leucine rich repeat-containing protein [Eubacterium uniforme]|uniref:Leucine rich repeat-containing protein n=1 Tax=Eubacterium uniforme TaxID=39495 RepID=A0A1T4VXS5_9FIRM|nr:leucine-rich repeat protein [Eubacterium uniforme]SKA69810.1 Leucine rich repeat-containing protein [Eubacterium uniforme]